MIPKFRAYNPATNNWYNSEDVFVCDGKIYLDDDDFEGLTQNNDVKLMQSTGVFDKNSKEIFEGDVVNIFDEKLSKIYYSEGAFCVDVLNGGTPLHVYLSEHLEIVGSIYENPELVEG
ncbi:TPA: YopX family protein [Streptococcus suis]